MEITEQIKKETDPIYKKVSKVIPEIEWAFHAPLCLLYTSPSPRDS